MVKAESQTKKGCLSRKLWDKTLIPQKMKQYFRYFKKEKEINYKSSELNLDRIESALDFEWPLIIKAFICAYSYLKEINKQKNQMFGGYFCKIISNEWNQNIFKIWIIKRILDVKKL